jgi:hypothetical protein
VKLGELDDSESLFEIGGDCCGLIVWNGRASEPNASGSPLRVLICDEARSRNGFQSGDVEVAVGAGGGFDNFLSVYDLLEAQQPIEGLGVARLRARAPFPQHHWLFSGYGQVVG